MYQIEREADGKANTILLPEPVARAAPAVSFMCDEMVLFSSAEYGAHDAANQAGAGRAGHVAAIARHVVCG